MKLPQVIKAETPKRAGLVSNVNYVLGHNPRKARLTREPGTNPKHVPGTVQGIGATLKRQAGGMSQHTAPYKHQTGLFSPNFEFGGPGSTEPV